MKNKKFIIILIIICSILAICIFWKMFSLQKTNKDNFSYGVVYYSSKDNKQYFLLADEKKIYFLDGYNPKNVFIVTSSINVVDDNAISLAKENALNGKFDFAYTGENRIYTQNILPAVYNWTPTIYDLKEQVNIVEEEYDYKEYDFSNIVCSEDNNKKLYYTDKFGRNIYTEGVDHIYVNYKDEKYELKTILEKNDSISDNVYLSFRKDSKTIVTYLSDDDDSVIEGLKQDNTNMYLGQKFFDNEIYYIFKCV